MFIIIKADIRRYVATEDINTRTKFLLILPFAYSLWSVLSYRFGRWARYECKIPVISLLLKILSRIIHEFVMLLTHIQIPFGVTIGKGLYIGHIGTLVINSQTIIGENCNLSAGVVIGQGGRGANKGSPTIGDGVFIGVGAKIFGKIKIGNNVAIGANAVVTKDIPDNAVVVGIPAKILNYNGSKEFVRY